MKRISAIGLVFALLSLWVCGSSAYPLVRAASKEKTKVKTLQDDQTKTAEGAETQPAKEAVEQSGPIGVFADIEAGWKSERTQ